MKMTREQLKAFVKECLLELLSEGLGDVSHLSARRESISTRAPISGVVESRNRVRRASDYDPRFDTPVGTGRRPTDALKAAVKENAQGNPVMESIFADTARTTLASQLAHGDIGTPSPGAGGSGGAPQGPVQQEQFSGSPEQVFGEESVSRWANLAFMDVSANKKMA